VQSGVCAATTGASTTSSNTHRRHSQLYTGPTPPVFVDFDDTDGEE
jgi:hypothetical protein